MGEQAPGARDLVDGRAGRGDLVVAQEIPALVVEGRAGQERDLGVAVHEDLLDVVLELVPGERIGAGQRRVPVLVGVLGEVEQAVLLEVVADEMRLVIDDELPREGLGPPVGHARRLRLGWRHVEQRPEHLVHGEEGRRHAGGARQEPAAVHPVSAPEIVGQILDPGLDLLLLAGLRQRVVLAVGHDLCGDRRPERADLGG